MSRQHVLACYVSADTFDSGITISLFLREGRATTGRNIAIRHRFPAFAANNLILIIATWIQSIDQIDNLSWVSSKFHFSFGHHTERIILAASAQAGWELGFNLPEDQFPFKNRPQIFRVDTDLWVITIPYWFLLTLFLLTWTTFLIWRTRTIRKHLNQIAHLTNP